MSWRRSYSTWWLLLLGLCTSTFVAAIPLRQIYQQSAVGPRAQCLTHISPADRTTLEQGLLAARGAPALVARGLPPSGVAPLALGNQTFAFNVSVNVVYANETAAGGWVSDERIRAQMEVLNRDFAGSGIAWVLVRIMRIKSADWFVNAYPGSEQEQAMKMMYNIGDAATLNVYTMTFNSTTSSLGTAAIPSAYYRAPKSDGVMLRHATVAGGARAHYNMGRTLTHEVGHWLGLFHTFEGGCPGGGPDLINNFMDYSYDECMSSFTKGQMQRMREAAWAFRRPGGRTAPPVKVKAAATRNTTSSSVARHTS
ncbi:metalloprotease [Pholiota molesta]|nr:metalloprotease [Pholiota molesta]